MGRARPISRNILAWHISRDVWAFYISRYILAWPISRGVIRASLRRAAFWRGEVHAAFGGHCCVESVEQALVRPVSFWRDVFRTVVVGCHWLAQFFLAIYFARYLGAVYFAPVPQAGWLPVGVFVYHYQPVGGYPLGATRLFSEWSLPLSSSTGFRRSRSSPLRQGEG